MVTALVPATSRKGRVNDPLLRARWKLDLAAVPNGAQLPLTEMYSAGTLCGVVAGFVLNATLGTRKPGTAT
jgi:hypothetical protein